MSRWSEDDKSRMADMWNRNWSTGEIAKVFGVTRNVVVGVINRMATAGDKRLTRMTRGASPSFKGLHPFSDKESLRILSLREDHGSTWETIGRDLKKAPASYAQHYHEIIRDLEASEQ